MSVLNESTSDGVVTQDIVYRIVDDVMLHGRWYQPSVKGQCPIVVDVHGGGWVGGDRNNNHVLSVYLASNGIGVFAVDFRMAPAYRFPVSVADVNYAIRWVRANALRLGGREDLICGLGTSSGGHLVLLNALRPEHPRHASKLESSPDTTASLACVIACWPVADPLARYRMVMKIENKALISAHHAFWRDEAEMHEGSPQRILEQGEAGQLAPLLIVQGTADENVEHIMANRFVDSYRSAGGAAELQKFENEAHAFITRSPESENSLKARQVIRDFIHRNLPTGGPIAGELACHL